MVPKKCLQQSVPIISSLRLACIETTLFAAADGLSNLVLVGHSFGISAACHLNRCSLGFGLGAGMRSCAQCRWWHLQSLQGWRRKRGCLLRMGWLRQEASKSLKRAAEETGKGARQAP